MSEGTVRYELSGFVSDTHVDTVDVTTFGRNPQDEAEYIAGSRSITVTTGRGSIELPWDAHPMLEVGVPVRFIVEVETPNE